MVFKLNLPRIVSVKHNSLMDYSRPNYLGGLTPFAEEARTMVSDHEVKMLVLWAFVSPSAGLAYLVWKKYAKMRVFALVLFGVGILQFFGQWGGLWWLIKQVTGTN